MKAKAKGSRKKLRSMHADVSLDEDATVAAEHWVHQELKSEPTNCVEQYCVWSSGTYSTAGCQAGASERLHLSRERC